jgi:hypothetical protein
MGGVREIWEVWELWLSLFPLFLIKLQIGVGVYCDLEVGACAPREEIAVYFLE